MTLKVRDGSATREAASLKVKHLGAVRTARTAKVYHSGALRTFFVAANPLTASASHADQTVISSLSSFSSDSVTVTPGGGTAPYSYSWAITSFEGTTPTIGNTSFATTAFTQGGLLNGEENTCTFTCTVTDALANTATAIATVTFNRDTGA
jgi:hypothetical protein